MKMKYAQKVIVIHSIRRPKAQSLITELIVNEND